MNLSVDYILRTSTDACIFDMNSVNTSVKEQRFCEIFVETTFRLS